jgi:putative ABC transport system permease protein
MTLATYRARPVLANKSLLREVYFSLLQHRKRVVATMASASIGIFGLVAGIGISRTRDAQTLNRFDTLAATHLSARAQPTQFSSSTIRIPSDAEARVERINGVVTSGLSASVRAPASNAAGPTSSPGRTVPLTNRQAGLDAPTNSPLSPPASPRVRSTPRQSDAAPAAPILVRASSPGLFPAIGASFSTGRPFTANHNTHADRVCVIGLRAANKLGIATLYNRPFVYIGSNSFEVMGILDDSVTKPELLDAVILPFSTAEQLYQTFDTSLEIQTSVNATNLKPGVLRRQIQLTLDNSFPNAINVTQPASLTNVVRDQVSGDLSTGFALLAGLLAALTTATIAISTSSALQTRTHEIGLRRALGAARKHIRQQIILEAAVTGSAAAIVGTLAGLLVTLAWAQHNHWKVVLDSFTIPGALVAGPLVGILGSIWPAWKASRQQPADTLRSM